MASAPSGGHQVVREGWLLNQTNPKQTPWLSKLFKSIQTKRSRHPRYKRRYLVLRSGELPDQCILDVYADEQKQTKDYRKSFDMDKCSQLDTYLTIEVSPDQQYQWIFGLHIEHEIIYLVAESRADMLSWVDDLTAAAHLELKPDDVAPSRGQLDTLIYGNRDFNAPTTTAATSTFSEQATASASAHVEFLSELTLPGRHNSNNNNNKTFVDRHTTDAMNSTSEDHNLVPISFGNKTKHGNNNDMTVKSQCQPSMLSRNKNEDLVFCFETVDNVQPPTTAAQQANATPMIVTPPPPPLPSSLQTVPPIPEANNTNEHGYEKLTDFITCPKRPDKGKVGGRSPVPPPTPITPDSPVGGAGAMGTSGGTSLYQSPLNQYDRLAFTSQHNGAAPAVRRNYQVHSTIGLDDDDEPWTVQPTNQHTASVQPTNQNTAHMQMIVPPPKPDDVNGLYNNTTMPNCNQPRVDGYNVPGVGATPTGAQQLLNNNNNINNNTSANVTVITGAGGSLPRPPKPRRSDLGVAPATNTYSLPRSSRKLPPPPAQMGLANTPPAPSNMYSKPLDQQTVPTPSSSTDHRSLPVMGTTPMSTPPRRIGEHQDAPPSCDDGVAKPAVIQSSSSLQSPIASNDRTPSNDSLPEYDTSVHENGEEFHPGFSLVESHNANAATTTTTTPGSIVVAPVVDRTNKPHRHRTTTQECPSSPPALPARVSRGCSETQSPQTHKSPPAVPKSGANPVVDAVPSSPTPVELARPLPNKLPNNNINNNNKVVAAALKPIKVVRESSFTRRQPPPRIQVRAKPANHDIDTTEQSTIEHDPSSLSPAPGSPPRPRSPKRLPRVTPRISRDANDDSTGSFGQFRDVPPTPGASTMMSNVSTTTQSQLEYTLPLFNNTTTQENGEKKRSPSPRATPISLSNRIQYVQIDAQQTKGVEQLTATRHDDIQQRTLERMKKST